MTAYTLGLSCPQASAVGGSPQPPPDLPRRRLEHLILWEPDRLWWFFQRWSSYGASPA